MKYLSFPFFAILFPSLISFLYLFNSCSPLLEYVKSLKITAAITKGSSGSIIVSGSEVTEIAAQKVDKVIDTTGAGDLFAAGFLYGFSRKKNMHECGNYASIAAAEIISHYGARPLVKLSNLI